MLSIIPYSETDCYGSGKDDKREIWAPLCDIITIVNVCPFFLSIIFETKKKSFSRVKCRK